MKDLLSLQNWCPHLEEPLLITGPCSAESESQILTTAQELKNNKNIHIFRAGIWKPRTRPHSFEGVGEAGLPWLRRVKKDLNLPVIIEVATPRHIDIALKYDIDMFWIGARTTVNPFQVQDIANRLKGLDIPVMVKNPISAHLDLWVGALERLYNAGLRKLAAIQRGFATNYHSQYRNIPLWEISLELKRMYPKLPIICDPSHIAGRRSLIPELCQTSLDMDMNGLMIEVHPKPHQALSDAKQQLTPKSLRSIIDELTPRSSFTQNPDFKKNMHILREKIDQIDKEILKCLSDRMNIVNGIAECKIQNHITAFQIKRMNTMLQDRLLQAPKKGLEKKYVNDIFKMIHSESLRIQTQRMSLSKTQKNTMEKF